MFGLGNVGKMGMPGGKLAAWSPLELFAASEEGAWYDISDLTTLYQDAAGTTPVTGAGDPVGLVLDAKGVIGDDVLGATDSTDWTAYASNTVADDGDSVLITYVDNGAGANIALSTLIPAMIDTSKTFKIEYDVKANAGALEVRIQNLTANSVKQAATVGSYVTQTFIGSWDGGGGILLDFFGMGAGESVNVKNLSVKEYTGNHATQSTAAARPLYQVDGSSLPYLDDDGIDDALTVTLPDLGTDATIAYVTSGGVTITGSQTISGATTLPHVDFYGMLYIDRALTAGEQTNLTAYFNTKAGL